jgi:hypothetical protein
MSDEPNNTTTAEQPARKRGQAKEKPARTRRNYAAELAALQQNVAVAVKLIKRKCPVEGDPILDAVMDLLS